MQERRTRNMRVGDLHVSQALHAMWGNSGTKTISLPTKSHVVMRLMPTTKTEITIGGGLQFSSNGNNTHANAVPAMICECFWCTNPKFFRTNHAYAIGVSGKGCREGRACTERGLLAPRNKAGSFATLVGRPGSDFFGFCRRPEKLWRHNFLMAIFRGSHLSNPWSNFSRDFNRDIVN